MSLFMLPLHPIFIPSPLLTSLCLKEALIAKEKTSAVEALEAGIGDSPLTSVARVLVI
jgi:hypothetical protein